MVTESIPLETQNHGQMMCPTIHGHGGGAKSLLYISKRVTTPTVDGLIARRGCTVLCRNHGHLLFGVVAYTSTFQPSRTLRWHWSSRLAEIVRACQYLQMHGNVVSAPGLNSVSGCCVLVKLYRPAPVEVLSQECGVQGTAWTNIRLYLKKLPPVLATCSS